MSDVSRGTLPPPEASLRTCRQCGDLQENHRVERFTAGVRITCGVPGCYCMFVKMSSIDFWNWWDDL